MIQTLDAPRIIPQGDAALVVEFGRVIDRAVSERVTALAAAVAAAAIPGVGEAVPTFRSLLIHYDPLVLDFAALAAWAETLAMTADVVRRRARLIHMPICYDEDMGPDLAEAAAHAGLSRAEAARLHASVDYHVYMLGFAPGLPYMGDLPEPLRMPRLATPRVRVPARSVGIASTLSTIYPLEIPGGWRLVGAVPTEMFDLARDPPALLRPGDRVRFRPVERAAFDDVRAAFAAGVGVLEIEAAAS